MMTEIYLKAFLGAIIITVGIKWILRSDWNGGLVFAGSFAGLILLAAIIGYFGQRFISSGKEGDKDKGEI
jgi:hypothetical protein